MLQSKILLIFNFIESLLKKKFYKNGNKFRNTASNPMPRIGKIAADLFIFSKIQNFKI